MKTLPLIILPALLLVVLLVLYLRRASGGSREPGKLYESLAARFGLEMFTPKNAAGLAMWPELGGVYRGRASSPMSKSYESIRYGLIPEQMEDKWFIFLEGDTLYFHRSRAGHCIFHLTLTREGEKYAVSDALVNRDAGQYGVTDDGYDERLLTYLIDNLLLGGRAVLPTPAGLPAGIQTDLYHDHVAGAQRKGAESPGEKGKRGWLWRWLMWG